MLHHITNLGQTRALCCLCYLCGTQHTKKISLSLSFNYIYYPAHVTKNEIITTTRKKSIVLFSHLFNNLRLERRVSVVSRPKIDKQRYFECIPKKSWYAVEIVLKGHRFKFLAKECRLIKFFFGQTLLRALTTSLNCIRRHIFQSLKHFTTISHTFQSLHTNIQSASLKLPFFVNLKPIRFVNVPLLSYTATANVIPSKFKTWYNLCMKQVQCRRWNEWK